MLNKKEHPNLLSNKVGECTRLKQPVFVGTTVEIEIEKTRKHLLGDKLKETTLT